MSFELPPSALDNRNNETAIRDRLLNIPAWNQLADPLPDGSLDPAAVTDCGEECVCMALYAATGLPFDAGAIRQAMGLPSSSGVTTSWQLQGVLSRLRLPAVVRSDHLASMIMHQQAAFGQGHVAIALGYWEVFRALHWILLVGTKDRGFWANDPWGGTRRHVTLEELTASWAGVIVDVNVN